MNESFSYHTVIFRGDLLNYNVFFLDLTDSQLKLNLSTVFEPGGVRGGDFNLREINMFSNSEDFTTKYLISRGSLARFGHKVPPQVPGIIVDWGLLSTQVCVTLKPRSVSHDDLCHVLDLSGGPRDSLKCSPTLFDPGGIYEFLANTAIYCGGMILYYQVALGVLIVSNLDTTDSDHFLSSVITLVFDPGGNNVMYLKMDFFITNITTTISERLALFLYYLEMCYIELDLYKVFFSMNYYLVQIATIYFFTNFVEEFTSVWTEWEGEERCLNLIQVATKASHLCSYFNPTLYWG